MMMMMMINLYIQVSISFSREQVHAIKSNQRQIKKYNEIPVLVFGEIIIDLLKSIILRLDQRNYYAYFNLMRKHLSRAYETWKAVELVIGIVIIFPKCSVSLSCRVNRN